MSPQKYIDDLRARRVNKHVPHPLTHALIHTKYMHIETDVCWLPCHFLERCERATSTATLAACERPHPHTHANRTRAHKMAIHTCEMCSYVIYACMLHKPNQISVDLRPLTSTEKQTHTHSPKNKNRAPARAPRRIGRVKRENLHTFCFWGEPHTNRRAYTCVCVWVGGCECVCARAR